MQQRPHLHLLAATLAILAISTATAPLARAECGGTLSLLGQGENHEFGRSVANLGDITQDGINDFAVGAPFYDANPFINPYSTGRAYIYSGADGALQFTLQDPVDNDQLGFSLSGAGDVNNDGIPDIVVGLGGRMPLPAAQVYSGANASLIWTFTGVELIEQFGISVDGAGDVNDDGFDDIIVGAQFFANDDSVRNGFGRVCVYSGQNGTILHEIWGEFTDNRLGRAVSGLGDVNGDGHDDFMAGAPAFDGPAPNSGRVYVFSGIDGSTLYTLDGEGRDDKFGEVLSSIGDIDADGLPDVIVGAPLAHSNHGRVYMHSGADGAHIRTFTGSNQENMGASVSPTDDLDGDGSPDLMIGATGSPWQEAPGAVYVYSTSTGARLHTILGLQSGRVNFGSAVATAGDRDADGLSDFIIASRWSDIPYYRAGNVFMYNSSLPCICNVVMTGDMDESGQLTLSDIILMINYMFKNYPLAVCDATGDVNCDGAFNSADVIGLVNTVLRSGPSPCNICAMIPSVWTCP